MQYCLIGEKNMTEQNKEITNSNYEERKWAELRLLFSVVLDDIRYHKDNQIKYLYYTIGLDSVIIFLPSWVSPRIEINDYRAALTLLSIVVLVLGILFTWVSQSDINKARNRISSISPYFTQEFNNILNHDKESEKTKESSFVVFWIYVYIQFLGGIIVNFVIWSI